MRRTAISGWVSRPLTRPISQLRREGVSRSIPNYTLLRDDLSVGCGGVRGQDDFDYAILFEQGERIEMEIRVGEAGTGAADVEGMAETAGELAVLHRA